MACNDPHICSMTSCQMCASVAPQAYNLPHFEGCTAAALCAGIEDTVVLCDVHPGVRPIPTFSELTTQMTTSTDMHQVLSFVLTDNISVPQSVQERVILWQHIIAKLGVCCFKRDTHATLLDAAIWATHLYATSSSAETQGWALTQVVRLWDLRRKVLKTTVVLPAKLEVATFAAPGQLLTQGQGHLVLWRNGRAAHRFSVVSGTLVSASKSFHLQLVRLAIPLCKPVMGDKSCWRLDLCAFM